jgi:hypothetical protein
MQKHRPSSRSLLALGTVLTALLPTAPHAQSFRCGNDLASVGDTKPAVQQKCGEPVARDAFCKPVQQEAAPGRQDGRVIVTSCENVDEWTYNPGRGQFMTTLRFESGRLKAIQYGDRVK